VYKHLGCSHGCGDGLRGPPADFLRSQGQTILVKLHHNNQTQFAKFLREFVKEQTLADVLEFFHAYLGFCVDPTSLLSPLSKFVTLLPIIVFTIEPGCLAFYFLYLRVIITYFDCFIPAKSLCCVCNTMRNLLLRVYQHKKCYGGAVQRRIDVNVDNSIIDKEPRDLFVMLV